MLPVLVDLGRWNLPLLGETPIFLPTYGALFATAVVLAWWWFMRRARMLGLSEELLFNLGFYTILAGILGAKLLLVLLDWRTYAAQPSLLLGTVRSAGVLYGGVLAGAVVFAQYCGRHGLPTWRLGDALAAPLALAQGVGRLGCFSAGCCWGVRAPAGHPLAVVFTDPRAAAQTGVPLHVPLVAVQLIEAASDLVLALLLTLLWRRQPPRRPGTVFWSYVLLYSAARVLIELWRGDAVRGLWFGGRVSTSQLFAAAGILVAAAVLSRGRLRGRGSDRA